jgi:hypothetical protein
MGLQKKKVEGLHFLTIKLLTLKANMVALLVTLVFPSTVVEQLISIKVP